MGPVNLPHPSARRRSRRLWLWYFLVLAILGTAAVVLPLVVNLGMQLKPDDVIAARKKWEAMRPANFDLELWCRENQEEADEYFVKVRGGQVTSVVGKNEGIVQLDRTALLALGLGITAKPAVPLESLPPLTVDAMFDLIEANLKRDATTSGSRNFATAKFDERDGHPLRYVHRRTGTKERLEWIVKLTPRGDVTP